MSARLPVAEHLRPPSPVVARDWCPLYGRLPEPRDRDYWRRYDMVDVVALDEALALVTEGQA